MASSGSRVWRLRSLRCRRPSNQAIAFWVLLLVYVLVTLGVVYRSPLLTLDTDLFKLNLQQHYPGWKPWIKIYVMFGQRGPATLIFLPWFLWVAVRNRTARPLIMLVTSLILLNLSVGVVKLATGRIGPSQTNNTHDIFVGGDIYPSGHVSNAVVLYGLIALIAVNHRKLATGVAAFLSITVGFATVYKDTHWFSDVLGGWIAGGLVLLALPWVMPGAERLTGWVWLRLQPRLPSRLRRLRLLPAPDEVSAPARGGAPATEQAPASPLGRPTTSPSGAPRSTPVRRPRTPPAGRPRTTPVSQRNETPVSSVARSHNFAATPVSLDRRDESTRRGDPRNSPIPSGP